jgi:DNA repair exonuclease SbcCD ATPase subunit
MTASLSQELANIQRAELALSRHSRVAELSATYTKYKSDSDQLQASLQERNAAVGVKNDTLSGIEEQLEELLGKLEDKGADGSSDAHASQSTKIRAAIKSLKADITSVDLSIGITDAMLLCQRMDNAKRHRSTSHRKAAMKKKKHGSDVGSGAGSAAATSQKTGSGYYAALSDDYEYD